MIVVDASAMVDLLLNTPPFAGVVAGHLRNHDGDAHAPHLLDAEVGQVIRRFVLKGDLSPKRARLAIDRLSQFSLTRYPHTPFLARAFRLRTNLTVYDALYVALAEALDASFLTKDAALARFASGHVDVLTAPSPPRK